MAVRISRRKLAAHTADQLLAGKKNAAQELAAYLVETHRADEYELIIRDIEHALATRGVLVADVTAAHELSTESKDAITTYLKTVSNAKDVQLRPTVDQSLLGGVRITSPIGELDGTLRRKMMKLRASKV